MNNQADTLTALAFFLAMVGGIAGIFAVGAWVGDWLQRTGRRRDTRNATSLEHYGLFDRERLP